MFAKVFERSKRFNQRWRKIKEKPVKEILIKHAQNNTSDTPSIQVTSASLNTKDVIWGAGQHSSPLIFGEKKKLYSEEKSNFRMILRLLLAIQKHLSPEFWP